MSTWDPRKKKPLLGWQWAISKQVKIGLCAFSRRHPGIQLRLTVKSEGFCVHFFILFKNSQKFRWLCEIFLLYHLSFKFMKSLWAKSMPTKQSSTRVLILLEVIMFTKFDLCLFIFYYFPPIFWSCLTWLRASCNICSSLILFSWTLTMILDFYKKKNKKDVSGSFILFAEYFSSKCELTNINGERAICGLIYMGFLYLGRLEFGVNKIQLKSFIFILIFMNKCVSN